MELPDLEKSLGVKYDGLGKSVTLPCDRWKWLNETKDKDGRTLLMRASRDGAVECVELFLRCGAQVNACAEVKGESGRKRAIDYSIEGDHHKVSLLLLQWDSYLPGSTKTIEDLLRQDVDIENLFKGRDEFHKHIAEGHLKSVEEFLGRPKERFDNPRHLVNSVGHSALHTALDSLEFDVWALLKAKRFEYVEHERECNLHMEEGNSMELVRTMGRHFIEIPKCHIHKMLMRTKILGEHRNVDARVKGIYEDIDSVRETSILLQCLQDELHFDVVLDPKGINIGCMYPGSSQNAWGVNDPHIDRVYASLGITESFRHSDVVGNLSHELAHKAMSVVFDNGGLPYRKDDAVRKEEYEKIVRAVLSKSRLEKCDPAIQRVIQYEEKLHGHELIVRVPEIISKYHVERDQDGGLKRLEHQAEELLIFYRGHVMPEMEEHIKNNMMNSLIPTCDAMRFPKLLSDHQNDYVEVEGNIKNVDLPRHNGVRFLQASNTKLAVSHLRKMIDGVVVVDWAKYKNCELYFETRLKKGSLRNVAIVWEKSMGMSFCKNEKRCEHDCPAKRFLPHKKFVILIFPKTFTVPGGNQTVEYKWKDLSGKSKDWIFRKKLNFQGRDVSLKELVESVVGHGKAESKMDSCFSSDDLSALIDEDDMKIGRPLGNSLKDRGEQLLRNHPMTLIKRAISLRPIDFNASVLDSRKNDVFFIFNAGKNEQREPEYAYVCDWNEESIPDGFRCFRFGGKLNSRNDTSEAFKKVCERLRTNHGGEGDEGNCMFTHLFQSRNGKFTHLHSENVQKNSRVVLLADSPGSGKSVFANDEARVEKVGYPDRWVEVVEWSCHEKEIKKWKKSDFATKENVETLLFNLIRGRECDTRTHESIALQKKIFKLFCHTKGRMFIKLDGFDEICPLFKEIITSFLEGLLEHTCVSFFVTTRVHECGDLERRLSTLSFQLVPFDRMEQLNFLNSEWNASLRDLNPEERLLKIKSIVSALLSSHSCVNEKGICDEIDQLEQLLERDGRILKEDIKFFKIAEKLLKCGRGSSGEDFTENPLQTWMVATVAFDENLCFGESLSLPKLYKRYVDIKIEICIRKEAKNHDGSLLSHLDKFTRNGIYMPLKNLSAWFFLEDEKYKVKDDDIPSLLKVGLIAKREDSIVFIHRTFGEYLFSIWLLEKADKKEESKVWLSRVLLENRFLKVREFIDGLLLCDYQKSSSGIGFEEKEWETSLLNQSSFPKKEDFVKSIQKALFQSILERHVGILQYLIECSEEMFVEVVFGRVNWDDRNLSYENTNVSVNKTWNAVTFCGQCIRGGIDLGYLEGTGLEVEYLTVQTKLLSLIEKDNLTSHLKEVISEDHLCWMGFNEYGLWRKGKGKKHLELMFQFLLRNRTTLGDTLRRKLPLEESKLLFTNAAIFSLELFLCFLDDMFENEDWEKFIHLAEINLVCSWTAVVKKCRVEKVRQLWSYLKGKMLKREVRRSFLWMKDSLNRNALFAAFLNVEDGKVLPYMLQFFRTELGLEDCKPFLFDSFEGVRYNIDFRNYAFLKIVLKLMKIGFLDGEEMTSLLLSRDNNGEFYTVWNPNSALSSTKALYLLQDILLSGRLQSYKILSAMDFSYFFILAITFTKPLSKKYDADLIEKIESDFNELLHSLLSHPLTVDFDWKESVKIYFRQHLFNANVKKRQLKTSLVMLKRQVFLDEINFGRNEFIARLKKGWIELYKSFPFILDVGDNFDCEGTREMYILYYIGILSMSLPKEGVAEVLLSESVQGEGTAFHIALMDEYFNMDPWAFLSLYDAARWCIGENALWRIHSFGRRSSDDKTVLELLHQLQDSGMFEDTEEDEVKPPPRKEILHRTRSNWFTITRTLKISGHWTETQLKQYEKPMILVLLTFISEVLSLSEEQLYQKLSLGGDACGIIFHEALECRAANPEAFYKLYDLARLWFKEDALWRVHSSQKVKGDEKTVLSLLIQRQLDGEFDETQVSAGL